MSEFEFIPPMSGRVAEVPSTTFIPYEPTLGARRVTGVDDVGSLQYVSIAAAFTASSAGETIELEPGGTDYATYNASLPHVLTVVGMGATLSGACSFTTNADDATYNFFGLEWSGGNNYRIRISGSSTTAQTVNIERCKFSGGVSATLYATVYHRYGEAAVYINGCLFEWNGTSSPGNAYVYVEKALSVCEIRNCVFRSDGTNPGGALRNAFATCSVYNSFIEKGSSSLLVGTWGGNNNATDDAAGLPGSGNHYNLTFGDHFDTYANNYFPQAGQTPDLTVAGSVPDASAEDYLGNDLTKFDVPIGAIALT